ncbi:glycoside hydrolase family 9 protein [Niabella insulamsoli]|uniref:glycoside hydrolase family 9 protein n=1 Tax=Niabella insulamsoli TaxID=3144874 RepID=UPI0031FC5C52
MRLLIMIFMLAAALAGHSQQSWIRINQMGYRPGDVKTAVLVTKGRGSFPGFSLIEQATGQEVYQGVCKKYGAYGPFVGSWRLDFSSVKAKGLFYLKAGDVQSTAFRIDENVYAGSADFILQYMRQQRSGYNPFLKDSCHRQDGFIVYHRDKTKDSTYLDVSGGWHDASDYLQYLPTSANATYQMLFAYLKNPASFSDHYDAFGNRGGNHIPDIIDEAKWGLDWLVKMNPAAATYYNQLADDRDHAGLRLPTKDSVRYSLRHGWARPVYFISGKPQGEKYKNKTRGVASSAGKFASAFALGAMVMQPFYPDFSEDLARRAYDAYQFGKKYPGNTQTLSVKAPYIYAEDNYVDDMELAALSLFQLSGDDRYLDEGIQYARQEPVTPWMGADSANHYQWYPFVNLGHYWGAQLDNARRNEYISFIKKGIDSVVKRGAQNPFQVGVPFIWCSNNLVVGILTQIRLYKELTGDARYDEAEAALRDWLFGCNNWGTSMICDLPEKGVAPKDPHSAFTHLYNYKISGGLVDGPVYGSIWKKLIGIKLYAPDEFHDFQSDLVVYHDDFGDYSTNEPTMDGTASLSYYLSAMQTNADAASATRDDAGAIIKMNARQKKIYLLFSAHEYADGAELVLNTLKRYQVKGSFFLTGDFLRQPALVPFVKRAIREGHYIGSHSDKHLLYADWEKRGVLLVSKDSFQTDLSAGLQALEAAGVRVGKWYLPPYEWYNEDIVNWCGENGLQVINFTPGLGTNADYTWPELPNYKSSDEIFDRLFDIEKRSGLAGSLILIHLGTDPRRKDKFYNKMGRMIEKLQAAGYQLERLP